MTITVETALTGRVIGNHTGYEIFQEGTVENHRIVYFLGDGVFEVRDYLCEGSCLGTRWLLIEDNEILSVGDTYREIYDFKRTRAVGHGEKSIKVRDAVRERPCYISTDNSRLFVRIYELEYLLGNQVPSSGSSDCKYANFRISDTQEIRKSDQWVNQEEFDWKYQVRELSIEERVRLSSLFQEEMLDA
ncbi:hypothetical protein [Chroococcidiopsis sp.]|uniref:hypothetical protein n=1 Tax=Chroococcidiopsis sp. TaxID=3088168 RepID=UPI003F391B35